MEIIFLNNPKEFLKLAEPFLLKNESFNNLFLGLASRLSEQKNPDEGEPFFYVVRESDTVISAAMRSSPIRDIILTKADESTLNLIVEDLKSKQIELRGVVGPDTSVESFTKLWGLKYSLVMDQGVYECRQPIEPKEIRGSLQKVFQEDENAFETAITFGGHFIKDCFPRHREPMTEARKTMGFHVDNGGIYLWKNEKDEFVSMAGNHRDSKNAGTIGWVYTPPEHRGKGYGSMVTHAVTQEVFKKGKTLANLFTDLANPTSNSIYQKIGFELIGHSTQIEFKNE